MNAQEIRALLQTPPLTRALSRGLSATLLGLLDHDLERAFASPDLQGLHQAIRDEKAGLEAFVRFTARLRDVPGDDPLAEKKMDALAAETRAELARLKERRRRRA
jgi:hypothetical protein